MHNLDEEKQMKWIELIFLLISIYIVVCIEDFKLWAKGIPKPIGDPE